MRLQRLVGPDRLEALDQVARRDDVRARLRTASTVPASTREM